MGGSYKYASSGYIPGDLGSWFCLRRFKQKKSMATRAMALTPAPTTMPPIAPLESWGIACFCPIPFVGCVFPLDVVLLVVVEEGVEVKDVDDVEVDDVDVDDVDVDDVEVDDFIEEDFVDDFVEVEDFDEVVLLMLLIGMLLLVDEVEDVINHVVGLDRTVVVIVGKFVEWLVGVVWSELVSSVGMEAPRELVVLGMNVAAGTRAVVDGAWYPERTSLETKLLVYVTIVGTSTPVGAAVGTDGNSTVVKTSGGRD